jgi:hypothetical protein
MRRRIKHFLPFHRKAGAQSFPEFENT